MPRSGKRQPAAKSAASRRRGDREALVPRSTLYTLFMEAPAIICVLRGPDHVFELVNPGYQQFFPGRQLLGRTLREAVPEVEGQEFLERLDNVYSTGQPYVAREARALLDRDGDGVPEEAFFNFIYQPVYAKGGEVEGIIVFAFEVTAEVRARHRGEKELRQAEEMLRLLIDSVQDYAIFMLDAEGRVATWNPGARRIKGYEPQEIIGRHFSIFYPPEDVRDGKPERLLAVAREHGRVEDEGWRIRKDGTRFWADAVLTAVHDEQGHLLGFGKVTRDVTERKKAEATERELLVAQEVNRAKDEFLALISHELRTPLTSILGWARMLRIGGLDEHETEEALDALERSTQAQVHLIEDLLDDARITSGKLRLDKRLLEIKSVVESALIDLAPQAEAKQIRIERELECEACSVGADPIRLQQVVWNIVSNAIKFTPEGGKVTVHLDRDETMVRIQVRDSGRGIDPKLLPQLFQRFRQADAASSRKAGIGLGLAISKYLVEQHDGRLTAESEGIGKGATFTIELPLANAASVEFTERDPKRTDDLPNLSGIRVLIVEDEADNRDMLVKAIKFCGAEVECCETAEEGHSVLDRWQPDVIVCDIGLPDVDGCEFLKTARLRFDTPALALTVFGSAEEEARVRTCGFDVFRQKPIEPADLAHDVERLAQSRRAAPQA